MIPLDSTIYTTNIGEQSKLSANDIISLNKAYSCMGTQQTNAGGHVQVMIPLILYIISSLETVKNVF